MRVTYKTGKINNTLLLNKLKKSNLQNLTSYSTKFNHYFVTSDRFSCPRLQIFRRNEKQDVANFPLSPCFILDD